MPAAARIAAITALALFVAGAYLPGAEARERGDYKERVRERLSDRRPDKAATASDLKGGEAMTLAGRSVVAWSPKAAPESRPSALVIFSHGDGGCATQSSFLMRSLADAGYLVVAPNHADARCGKRKGAQRRGGKDGETASHPSYRDPEAWTDQTYINRRDDIQAVVSAVLSDARFAVDPNQIGLVGHSLGGYTSLGLAGGWDSWQTPSIRAVVALSPVCTPFTSTTGLGGVAVPVQFQGGTRDAGITPAVRRPDGCYDQTPAPAAFVEFEKAGHAAWTDAQTGNHDDITRYTVAWLDHHVRALSVPALPTRSASVSDQRSK